MRETVWLFSLTPFFIHPQNQVGNLASSVLVLEEEEEPPDSRDVSESPPNVSSSSPAAETTSTSATPTTNLKALQDENTFLHQRLKDVEIAAADALGELQDYKERLAAAKEAQSSASQAEAEAQALRSKLDKAKKQFNLLKQQLKAAKDSEITVKDSLSELQSKLDQQTSRVSEVQQELEVEKMKKDKEEVLGGDGGVVEEMKQKVDNLEKQLKKANKEAKAVDVLKQKVADLEKQLVEKEEIQKELEAKMEKAENQAEGIDALEVKIRELERQLAESEKTGQQEELQQQVEQLQGQLEHGRLQIDQLTAQVADLEKQLASERTASQERQERFTAVQLSFKKTLEVAQNEAAQASTRAGTAQAEAQQQVLAATKQAELLRRRVEELEHSVESKTNESQQQLASAELLRRRVEELEAIVESNAAELQLLQESNAADRQMESNTAGQMVESLQKELDEVKMQLLSAIAACDAAESENIELNTQLTALVERAAAHQGEENDNDGMMRRERLLLEEELEKVKGELEKAEKKVKELVWQVKMSADGGENGGVGGGEIQKQGGYGVGYLFDVFGCALNYRRK